MRKILKYGKGDYRKFVCPKCECVFVADRAEAYPLSNTFNLGELRLNCTCGSVMHWEDGTPYDFEKAANVRKERLSLSIYGMDDRSPVDVVERLIADSAFIDDPYEEDSSRRPCIAKPYSVRKGNATNIRWEVQTLNDKSEVLTANTFPYHEESKAWEFYHRLTGPRVFVKVNGDGEPIEELSFIKE